MLGRTRPCSCGGTAVCYIGQFYQCSSCSSEVPEQQNIDRTKYYFLTSDADPEVELWYSLEIGNGKAGIWRHCYTVEGIKENKDRVKNWWLIPIGMIGALGKIEPTSAGVYTMSYIYFAPNHKFTPVKKFLQCY